MSNPRRSLPLLALVLALVASGCGQSVAKEGNVHDAVVKYLTDDGDRTVPDVDADQAEAIATCVTDALFSSGAYTRAQRNDLYHALDGDRPDPALVTQVTDLVDGCRDDAGAAPATG
jgi:hypothetical protein